MTKKQPPPQPVFPSRELCQAFLLIQNFFQLTPDLRVTRFPRNTRLATLIKVHEALKLWNHWLELATQEHELEETEEQ